MYKRALLALGLLLTATAPAFAHLDPIEHGSFAAGFTHPLFGLDHILAMIAVGLWAATVARSTDGSPRALWLVPLAFVATMAAGFVGAIIGIPLVFVEPVILASVIFIGIMVALALPVPALGVASVVAFFALFHGYAHGGEMGEAGTWGYAAGFLAATAMLHAVGIAIAIVTSRIVHSSRGLIATRVAGLATTLAGFWLAFGA